MNNAPDSPTDQAVLELIQREWREDADRASYLPVGFGAYHWRIDVEDAPLLFATLDVPSEHRSPESFEQAYASASALASSGFEGVGAPLRARSGRFTASLEPGLVSVTPWLQGRNPSPAESRDPGHVARLVALLQRLHGCEPPNMLPRWKPRVSYDFHDSLGQRLLAPWIKGPFGQTAREKIFAAKDVVGDSLREYHMLGAIALDSQDRWVPTHGEPHWANQFLVGDELLLIDWDTIALGPPEIDMVDLPLSARHELGATDDMLRMFRLEWQLVEIAKYADRFEGKHSGDNDDRFALEKLEKELRPV